MFNTIIQKKSEIILNQLTKVIIEISTDLFSILGIFVYIEFIEIKFCGLNYNLRKYIERRISAEMNCFGIDKNDVEYDDENEDYYINYINDK